MGEHPESHPGPKIEALNQGQVDLVLTGPAEYAVIKELTDAQIVTAWQRPNYYAQIVALSEGPVAVQAFLRWLGLCCFCICV